MNLERFTVLDREGNTMLVEFRPTICKWKVSYGEYGQFVVDAWFRADTGEYVYYTGQE